MVVACGIYHLYIRTYLIKFMNISLCMCNVGYAGTFIKELEQFKQKTLLFYCLWMSTKPPDASSNMEKHWHLGRFQDRGRKGKYPGQIPPGWKCNNYTNLGMTWMNRLWSFGINRSIVILSDHTEVLMFFRPPRIFLALYLCVCVCESHSRNIPTSFRVIDCWKICACYHSIFF